MIKYFDAPDIQKESEEISKKLFPHIRLEDVHYVRSRGTNSRRTIARCHALSRIWQRSLGIKAKYIIEIISERFDKFSEEEKTKTIIHELMHIPKAFGGGFKHHNYVCEKNVQQMHKKLKDIKKIEEKNGFYF